MKIILIGVVFFYSQAVAQKFSEKFIDLSCLDIRCAVAHITDKGVFTCDFKDTYYPEIIFDSTIYKWFIKVVNGDSLFYYRNDVEIVYIWNGRPKK